MRILKLDEVRKLRMKTGIKLKKLLFLDYDGNNVLDSSHLIGARRILKFVRAWQERKAKEKEKETNGKKAPVGTDKGVTKEPPNEQKK